jgi:hypothetical protein
MELDEPEILDGMRGWIGSQRAFAGVPDPTRARRVLDVGCRRDLPRRGPGRHPGGHVSAHDFADAVRAEARRIAQDQQSIHLAVVVDTDPLVLELMDSRHTLHDDQIVLSQWVKKYDAADAIDPDDVVTLIRKKRNGETVWLVTDVIADKDPT